MHMPVTSAWQSPKVPRQPLKLYTIHWKLAQVRNPTRKGHQSRGFWQWLGVESSATQGGRKLENRLREGLSAKAAIIGRE